MKYGVKRLIAINSGKFELAEFDLAHSVHLSAPNNRGKSTLVNALQFIYVDQINRMHFGKRELDDTRDHYFGRDPSYLVFECATPSGIQTMLVCGRAFQAGQFERFVYARGYNRDDYVASDGIIRSLEDVKARLGDRELTEVPTSHLWEVLSGQIVSKGKPLPRLGILPLRTHDEYQSFREVFVGLLKMKNADARLLRKLVIACHARDIGERRVDVAALYRDMFDRATRSERELELIRSIAGLIDEGAAKRVEIHELTTVLRTQAAPLWTTAGQCSAALLYRLAVIEQSSAESGTVRSSKYDGLKVAQRDQWTADQEQQKAEQEKKALEGAHLRWGGCSPEMIQTMQEEAADLARGIARLEDDIRKAGTFDHRAMRREVAELALKNESNSRLVKEFGRRVLAYLLHAGLDPGELEKAFHVLHPDTLKLIVGDHVEVQSPENLVDRVRAISARVQQGVYRDDAVFLRLGAIRAPDLRMMRNRDDVVAQLELDEQRLRESQDRLRVAEGLEPAKQELKEKRVELERRNADLEEYARYAHAWSGRQQLDIQLAAARTKASQAAERVRILEGDLKQLDEQIAGWRDEKASLGIFVNAVRQSQQEFRAVVDRLNLPLTEYVEEPQVAPLALAESVASLQDRIRAWMAQAKGIDSRSADLRRIESRIVEESTNSRARHIYFDDAEATWDELTEAREALAEQESSVRKQWDDLFTLLTANFEQIIIGLRNVEIAVRSLNRGVKSYQVSNLKAVELSVEKIRVTYNAIETLANKGGIFQDADNIESAKRKLQSLIEGQQVIELENLFEIRIRVQDNDGRWNEAKSLDDIGSTGTGITAKAMIFIQLVRAIINNSEAGLHFYLDETAHLDEDNLRATTAMAVSRGMIPITAQPSVRMECLAHPDVTVYTLGTTAEGRFRIESYQTYHARRAEKSAVKASHESNRAEVLEESA